MTGIGGTEVAPEGGKGLAWHLVADAPITAYDIIPYGGARTYLPGAELLFPTTAWGTNYLGIVPPKGGNYYQYGQVVAVQDGTLIDVLPPVDLPGANGIPPAYSKQRTSFKLDAGEYIQWSRPFIWDADMSGTVLKSNKPVAFFGGNSYFCIGSSTSNGGGCDATHEQIPPIGAFGHEYALPSYATRRPSGEEEAIPHRVVGAAPGTLLTYNPLVPDAPTHLDVGETVDFEAIGPFVVTSQDADHPFFIAQVMTGSCVDDACAKHLPHIGDEDFVLSPPPAQFLARYVFFTDPSYPTTNLVFTRVLGSQGFGDVKIDCLGLLTGWRPIGTNGQYEVTTVDLIRKGTPNGNCANGPHVAESSSPFGLVVWGLDTDASYGYPAGGNIATINPRVIIIP